MRSVILIVLSVVLAGMIAGCVADSDQEETPSVNDDDPWYLPERWPHDGNPFQSENFIVYSDAASTKARRETAEVAEQVWAGLLDEFSIEPALLHYPDGQNKIDVFAFRDHDPKGWEARAYFGSLVIWSPDHEQHRRDGDTRLAPVLTHELVHVLQSMIAGPDPNPIDVWFFEGVAETISGGTAGGVIKGQDQLDELTARHGRVSPISVTTYDMIPSPDVGERFSYPMFQLAVDYLLDDDGYGRSPADVRDVLVDVADGASFDVAFE
ncbi:MAG: hypothetical protein OER95_06775, partial [Acidimicrobiia bacterium]|nr:hypothetical protein [Acidimicrobiia bacterium]